MSAPTPRVTAADPFDTHPAAAHDTMPLHCLQKIMRTRGLKPAAAAWATHEVQHRGNENLIAPDGDAYDCLHSASRAAGRVWDWDGGFSRTKTPARLATFWKSVRSSSKVAPAAFQRAMTTSHTPGARGVARKISRRRRRTRFLCTAPPTFREVMRPDLQGASSSARKTPSTT